MCCDVFHKCHSSVGTVDGVKLGCLGYMFKPIGFIGKFFSIFFVFSPFLFNTSSFYHHICLARDFRDKNIYEFLLADDRVIALTLPIIQSIASEFYFLIIHWTEFILFILMLQCSNHLTSP